MLYIKLTHLDKRMSHFRTLILILPEGTIRSAAAHSCACFFSLSNERLELGIDPDYDVISTSLVSGWIPQSCVIRQ